MPRLDQVDSVCRGPMSFLVGSDHLAARAEAEAVGGAEAVAEDFRFAAVLAYFQQGAVLRHDSRQRMARTLGVIEISLSVGLEAHREFVEMLGHLVIVVE